ncbi:hypothetical protein SBOR_2004 [Sclerotinia borealis F-4128]|uniref:Uncharacterized protein n=1 Tax=Sclerotinia borealis (strain F-4128) TaxID=1432307 RepID=W9CNH5_SCLBF|nr:hypothetical protein SBOR_2004 [Sclerotinia borealis F-4128]
MCEETPYAHCGDDEDVELVESNGDNGGWGDGGEGGGRAWVVALSESDERWVVLKMALPLSAVVALAGRSLGISSMALLCGAIGLVSDP